jgi:hypothetical protein
MANNLGLLENVKIELIKGASTTVLKATTKSDGTDAVVIPAGAYTGAQIKVTWLDDPSVSGTVTINIS